MKKVRAPNQKGFTIVELLIVIVVIALLAVISVVAYSGMQTRARNTQRISAANQYLKILKIYATTYGKYPMASSGSPNWGYVCLGEGFPDVDSDGVGDCRDVGGTMQWTWHEDPIVNAEMKKVSSSLPRNNMKPITTWDGSLTRIGMFIEATPKVYDGKDFLYLLTYYLEGGNQSCGSGDVITYDDGGWPNFTASTLPYSWTDGVMTGCDIYLPNID